MHVCGVSLSMKASTNKDCKCAAAVFALWYGEGMAPCRCAVAAVYPWGAGGWISCLHRLFEEGCHEGRASAAGWDMGEQTQMSQGGPSWERMGCMVLTVRTGACKIPLLVFQEAAHVILPNTPLGWDC